MVKKKKLEVSEAEIQESPAPPVMVEPSIVEEEKEPVLATQTVAEMNDPLKSSLRTLVDAAPTFEQVKDNPWLYETWRNAVAQLVK